MSSAHAAFDLKWEVNFPDTDAPELSCLDMKTTQFDNENQQQEYRQALKTTLDVHAQRIAELTLKLEKEQFIAEFLAQEIENIPVPRQTQLKQNPVPNGDKPKPKPRAPPVSKKPNPVPRGSGSSSPDHLSGNIRRNNSTPVNATSHSVSQFSNRPSSYMPKSFSNTRSVSESPNDTTVPVSMSPRLSQTTISTPDSNTSEDVRFRSFQGSTFGGATPSQLVAVSAPQFSLDRNSPATVSGVTENRLNDDRVVNRVSRSSMQRMTNIEIEDHVSSSSDSNEDTSDYMQLWITPQLNMDGTKIDPSANIAEQTGDSQLASLEDDIANSSAASIQSGQSRTDSRKNRMVRVDYGTKDGKAVVEDGDNEDPADFVDSDFEDDQPQYVRLMHRAYSNAAFLSNPRPEADSSSITSADSQDFSERQAENGSKVDSVDLNVRPEAKRPHSLPSLASEEEDSTIHGMRKSLIRSILKSEVDYIGDIDVLLRYKKSLVSAASTSQPMISIEESAIIFGNLSEIHDLHSSLRQDLEPIVAHWTERSQVYYFFMSKAANLTLYQKYLSNYSKAIETLQRCCQEKSAFNDLVVKIKCPSTQEQQHLSEILHRPINRMQRNSLDLQEFIKVTPITHPDYTHLQKALSQSQKFLDTIQIGPPSNAQIPLHVLIKNQLLVELVRNKFRKLRHVFLFHDVIICTKVKQVNSAKDRYQYEVKWHAPLCELDMSDKVDDTPVQWKKQVEKAEKEITQMKTNLKALKHQLKREFKECREKQLSTDTNKVAMLTRKIQTLEGNLLLAEPRLRLTLKTRKGHQFVFLLPSDYERREWLESIKTHKANRLPKSFPKLSYNQVQEIIDNCKEHIKLNNVEDLVHKEAADDTVVNGQLTVTIHQMLGLQYACDTFTTIEVDSFGHVYQEAKTSIQKSTQNPVWNESFELDLESSTTLKLICYQKTGSESTDGDKLLGRSKLDLSTSWLMNGFSEKEISMNEVTLKISIKYKIAPSISRHPTNAKVSLFGASISSTCANEGTNVPVFVKSCIEDVEHRGLDEVGIYRVSASTSDVQKIKKAFDKSTRDGKLIMKEVEINAVTGALKLYFRELPEALFTDDMYNKFIEKYVIKDDAERKQEMISLLASLPDPNYHTILAILNHLVVVGEHEADNKMGFYNLAVVFGPTLLKPAQKTESASPMDLFSSSAHDATYQSRILYYYLTLVKEGTQFRDN